METCLLSSTLLLFDLLHLTHPVVSPVIKDARALNFTLMGGRAARRPGFKPSCVAPDDWPEGPSLFSCCWSALKWRCLLQCVSGELAADPGVMNGLSPSPSCLTSPVCSWSPVLWSQGGGSVGDACCSVSRCQLSSSLIVWWFQIQRLFRGLRLSFSCWDLTLVKLVQS